MSKTQLHPLRAYRREHGLNCDQLGKKVGLAGSTIRHYENGTRVIDGDAAVTLEKKLGIPRDRLRPDLWSATAA